MTIARAFDPDDLVPTPHDPILLTPSQYEEWRPRILRSMLRLKRRRRVALGRDATVVFENRDIVLFHLHERLRAECVIDRDRRAQLMAEHRQLLPAPGELRATLFLDGPDRRRCSQLAQRLGGPFSPVSLAIGGRRIRGDVIDPAPVSVHYLRFAVADAARALGDGAPVALCLACDAGGTRVRLPAAAIHELGKDLGLDPGPSFSSQRGPGPSRWLH